MVCEHSAPRVVTEQLIRSFDQMAPVRFEDILTSIARPKARATRSTRSLTPPASSPISRCPAFFCSYTPGSTIVAPRFENPPRILSSPRRSASALATPPFCIGNMTPSGASRPTTWGASRKPDGQSSAEGASGDCSAQRADAHYQYLHFEASKMPAMRLKPTSCLKNRALSPPLPATGVIFDLFWRRDVLGLAVTKGPIFLRDFNKVDEDVFLANLYSFVEMVR